MTKTSDETDFHEHDAAGCLDCDCASAPMNSAPCTCGVGERECECPVEWISSGGGCVCAASADADDTADRLSELLCDLTGGRMSKTNYSVATMRQAIEAEFERDADQARIDGAAEALRRASDFLFTIDATENGIGSAQRWLKARAEQIEREGSES